MPFFSGAEYPATASSYTSSRSRIFAVILDRAFRSQHQSAPISLHLRRTCPSRIDCISDFLLACFEVAPGAACSDLGRRQNAFGFHHERAGTESVAERSWCQRRSPGAEGLHLEDWLPASGDNGAVACRTEDTGTAGEHAERSQDEERRARAAATVAPVPAAQLAIPQPAPETTNEYMAKLNWPPLPSQPPAKDPLDDKTVPHKWQTAKPTPPDKSQRPLPPDLGENEPIY